MNESFKTLPAKSLRRSVPAVVNPWHTLEVNEHSLASLTLLLSATLSQLLSPDSMAIALFQARREAKKMGVPDKEFERVMRIVFEHWRKRRNQNPLSGLY